MDARYGSLKPLLEANKERQTTAEAAHYDGAGVQSCTAFVPSEISITIPGVLQQTTVIRNVSEVRLSFNRVAH